MIAFTSMIWCDHNIAGTAFGQLFKAVFDVEETVCVDDHTSLKGEEKKLIKIFSKFRIG
jgi:hypothetical protein